MTAAAREEALVPGPLDLLISPERALAVPGVDSPAAWPAKILAIAQQYHAEQDWQLLAELYQRLADQAWKQGYRVASVRLLLAERSLAARLGDQDRLRHCTYFLAARQRLQDHFLPAEAWAREILRGPLDAGSATMHIAAWRELAVIREVSSDYGQGLDFCTRAEAVCGQYARVSGIAGEHAKTLLQRVVLLRLRGSLDGALEALHQAADLAASSDVDDLTRGLIQLRAGTIQSSVGRADAALAAYQSAGEYFTGLSEHNLLIARVRQIACLRTLGRAGEALELATELAGRFPPGTESRRLGQVLLERADVQEDLGDEAGVLSTLEQARPFFEGGGDLESLRWHLHVARTLISRGDRIPEAMGHLRHVLQHAAAADRGDLTRTMLALHDVTRLPETAGISTRLRVAASRAAFLAAELQRDSLSDPAERWSLHALREETYAAAVLLHAEIGDAVSVAHITEAGRADLLNQLLSGGPPSQPSPVTGLPVVPQPLDPGQASRVFGMAAEIGAALAPGAPFTPPEDLVPRQVLAAGPDLDELASVIVLTHLIHTGSGWWAVVATRPRGGTWDVTTRTATPAVSALLGRLNAGQLLPARGISSGTWEELGAFLLPGPAIWPAPADQASLDPASTDPTSTVLVCPDPRLWQVPYAALTRHGIALAEVAQVTLTPSLRTSRLLRQRSSRNPAAPGAPGGPPAHQVALAILDPTLPGYSAELGALAAWPGGLRALATIADLPPGPGPALLYVSGHGDKPGEASELGPTGLTLDRLAAARLPPLVFLNGCWSGTTSGRFGQDPFSLAVGALIGGAELVVAGIGLIGSAASAHIAAHTLTLLGQGVPPGPALHLAQRHLRSSHPELTAFDWAGLSIIGWSGPATGSG